MLSDGVAAPISVGDGSGMDSNALPGVITFSGVYGGTWTANVTTGISKPTIGSPSNPKMDLNSVNVSGGGAGTLTISLTDTDFTGPLPGGAVSAIGGTTDGSVSYSTYFDDGNGEFAKTTLLSTMIPVPGGGGAFASSANGLFPGGATAPFSLTQEVSITHTAGEQISSFNAIITPVPDGGTAVMLLGLSLLGISGFRRKLMKK